MTTSENLSAPAVTAEARRTRAEILATAEKHFKRYGYDKTTIVDVARDCAMSHANVYRFFRNKAHLADAVATQWIEKLVLVAQTASSRTTSAPERLCDVAVELYRAKKREYLRSRPIHELFLAAEVNGLSCMQVYQERIDGIFAAIINDGIASGEFRQVDSAAAAAAVHASLAKFFHPVLVEQFQDEDGEAQIRMLFELLSLGLQR